MTSMIGTSEPESLSQQVVAEVAETTGKDPLEMEPLYTRIDPGCLDSIFGDRPGVDGRFTGRVSFTMAGCRVVVEADRTVDVTDHGETAETTSPDRHASDGANEAEPSE